MMFADLLSSLNEPQTDSPEVAAVVYECPVHGPFVVSLDGKLIPYDPQQGHRSQT